MTEPTPDTPESELTGDGLQERLATELWGRFGWGSDRSHQSDETLADPGATYWFDEAAAILAALPNREAAPVTGDGLRDAIRAAWPKTASGDDLAVWHPKELLDLLAALPNREAAPEGRCCTEYDGSCPHGWVIEVANPARVATDEETR